MKIRIIDAAQVCGTHTMAISSSACVCMVSSEGTCAAAYKYGR